MSRVERGSAVWEKRVIAVLETQAKEIKAKGYTGQHVFPNNPPEALVGDETFFYTTGMFQFGWPEIVVLGNLAAGQSDVLVKKVFDFWTMAGKPILGDVHIKGIRGDKIRLRAVTREAGHKYTKAVRTFKGDMDFDVVQLLWPSNLGFLPDHPKYDALLTTPQLVLEAS